MRYYHSGINSYALIQMLAEEGVAGMINARCACQPAIQRGLEDFPDVPFALDSGAFQEGAGERWDVEDYGRQLRRLDTRRFEWCANLDVMGNQHVSDLHYIELTEVFYMRVLYVLQLGAGREDHLAFAIDEGILPAETDLVGVGGLIPYGKKHGQAALSRRIEAVGRVLEEADMRAHFFGLGAPRLLQSFAGAEWIASADSSKFLAGLKGRLLYRLDGSRVKAQEAGIALGREACAKNNLRQVERWARGVGAPWATGTGEAASSAPLFEAARSGPAPCPAKSPPAPNGRCVESFQAERGGPAQREEAHQVDALDPTLLIDEREPFVRW